MVIPTWHKMAKPELESAGVKGLCDSLLTLEQARPINTFRFMWPFSACSLSKFLTMSKDFVKALANGLMAELSASLFMIEEPAAKHSAPNHSWPARFSCITSSGNFTLKSRFALLSGISSSIIWLHIVNTLSWQWRSWLTSVVHLSGSWRPSNESNSQATAFKDSSA